MKKSKRISIIIVSVVLVIGVALGLVGRFFTEKKVNTEFDKIALVDTVTIELDNQKHEYKPQDFIKENTNTYVEDDEFGALVVEYANSDNTIYEIEANEVKEEKVDLVAYFDNFSDKTKEYSIAFSVVDTTAPMFTEKVDTINITEGDELDVASKFRAEDASGDVEIKVEGEVDVNKVGTQTITVFAIDKNGNVAEQEVKVVVEEKEVVTETTTQKQETSTSISSTSKKTTSNKTTTTSTTTKKNNTSTTKKNNSSSSTTSASSPNKTTTSHTHTMPIGNVGKWFDSKDDFVAYYKSVMNEWNAKLDNGEISYEEYGASSPCGYECWCCATCGKFAGNFKYR